MSLNIDETAVIFDDVEDEESMEDYDASIANILGNMKNSNIIKKKQTVRKPKDIFSERKPKSSRRDSWLQYVRDVKKELDSTSEIPISYKAALSEASRRRNIDKNVSEMNILRQEKVNQKRKSVKFSEEIEVEKEDSKIINLVDDIDIEVRPESKPIVPVYSYRMIYNDTTIGLAHYIYKSYKDCLCVGLIDYLQQFSENFNINNTRHPDFRDEFYMKRMSPSSKLIFNCWIKEYFGIIYDEFFTDEIEEFNMSFLKTFPRCDLEFIISMFEVIAKNQKNSFPYLKIVSLELID